MAAVVNGAAGQLVETSWQWRVCAASEGQFAALFILDVQWRFQGSGTFTDPGVHA